MNHPKQKWTAQIYPISFEAAWGVVNKLESLLLGEVDIDASRYFTLAFRNLSDAVHFRLRFLDEGSRSELLDGGTNGWAAMVAVPLGWERPAKEWLEEFCEMQDYVYLDFVQVHFASRFVQEQFESELQTSSEFQDEATITTAQE